MLLPIYFLGLVMGFRKRDNWAAIVIASAIVSIIAYKTIGSPWHVSIGALAGILVAVIVAKPEKAQGADADVLDILDHYRRRSSDFPDAYRRSSGAVAL